MRRGALGARLCDHAPCPAQWPCAVHGTASVGDYEHLGRHAGQVEFDMYIDVLDVASCSACGYALCSCEGSACDEYAQRRHPEQPVGEAERPPPDGWERQGERSFVHSTGAVVAKSYGYGACWYWRLPSEAALRWYDPQPTGEKAMAAALAAVKPAVACHRCGARDGLVRYREGTVWGCGDANACHERCWDGV